MKNFSWYGRENEVVNIFAHKFLIKKCNNNQFKEPSQIGIEVAVKQLPGINAKKLVLKDLVIWEQPQQTVWQDGEINNNPVAVIEWKINDKRKCGRDIGWLHDYTKHYPTVLGYSVCAMINSNRGLIITKIVKEKRRKL